MQMVMLRLVTCEHGCLIILFERQNKKLTERNDVLTKNVETLKRSCAINTALYEVSEEQERVLKTSIMDTGLPFRVIHALAKLKINRVIDLVRLSRSDIINARCMGEKSVEAIIHYLGTHDLQLNTYVYVDAETKTIKLSNVKKSVQEDCSW